MFPLHSTRELSLLSLHHLCMTQKCVCSALIRVCMRELPDSEARHRRGFATLGRKSWETLRNNVSIFLNELYQLFWRFKMIQQCQIRCHQIQCDTHKYFFLAFIYWNKITTCAWGQRSPKPFTVQWATQGDIRWNKSVSGSVSSHTGWWHSVDNQRWCWLQTASGSTPHTSLIS